MTSNETVPSRSSSDDTSSSPTPGQHDRAPLNCTTDSLCRACSDLFEECGIALFDLYHRKLLIRGWAGRMSRVERAYVEHHRSQAMSELALRRAVQLRSVRFQGQKPSETSAFVPADVSDVIRPFQPVADLVNGESQQAVLS